MSSTQTSSTAASDATARPAITTRLETVVLPVSDVDRAKAFYVGLGWRIDADVADGDYRLVQLTPPGSDASVIFGRGVTAAQPGAGGDLLLVVDDLDAAREALAARGADVGEPFHDAAGGLGGGFYASSEKEAAGPDPERRSYASYARFRDPDGNRWLLQEITTRLPGRVESLDVEALATLLHETAEHHDAFEKASPPHDWWDWYAAYADARQRGADAAAAEAAADTYMADVKGVRAMRG